MFDLEVFPQFLTGRFQPLTSSYITETTRLLIDRAKPMADGSALETVE